MIGGAFARRVGRKPWKQAKRPAWFCVPPTRVPWLIVLWLTLSGSRLTWRDAKRLLHVAILEV